MSFRPYSSSFGALRWGQLVREVVEHKSHDPRVIESPKIPVAEKFSRIYHKAFKSDYILKVQGKPRYKDVFDLIKGEELYYKKKYYTQEEEKKKENGEEDLGINVESWEGICDQWSRAALHKNVHQIFEGGDGYLCEMEDQPDIYFTMGEMKELVFHLFAFRWGKMTEGRIESLRSYEIPRELSEGRKILGLDDIDPYQLERNGHEKIKRDEGFVLERDSGYQLWNYPIFKAETLKQTLHPKVWRSDYLKLIPLSMIEPLRGYKEVLSLTQQAEEILIRGMVTGIFSEDEQREVDIIKGKLIQYVKKNKRTIDKWGESEGNNQIIISSLAKIVKVIKKYLLTQTPLKEQLQEFLVVKKRTIFDSPEFVSFAKTESKYGRRAYDYIVFHRGDVSKGRWLTTVGKRPDSMITFKKLPKKIGIPFGADRSFKTSLKQKLYLKLMRILNGEKKVRRKNGQREKLCHKIKLAR